MRLKRKEIILKYIVEDYIRTAEPVGSISLLNAHKLNYSSATIRNVMMELEKEDYIEKTHTSSGRIPSTKGYRYYVEHLRNEKIDKSIKFEIDGIFDSSKSIEQILNESCLVLSHMTRLACCVLGPSIIDEKIVDVSLIPINEEGFVIIFVTNKGFVGNKTFLINKDLKMEELVDAMRVIDLHLKQIKIIDVKNALDELQGEVLDEYKATYNYLYKSILSVFSSLFSNRSSTFYGKSYLFEEPEFKDSPDEIKKLIEIFSNSDKLAQIFSACGNEVSISIGNGRYKDITIITKDVKFPSTNEEIGRIAVVGPTRMNYERVIKYLDYVVEMINNHLKDLKEVKING